MSSADSQDQGYNVPTYQAPADTCWYHFLHGNVPGHQIDFIYRPEVPQGALMQQHFSHLARIIRYIEPRAGAPYAFSIGNLSRDDTQHEPGHGGVALILGHRMKGAMDHAGRRDPPFAHGIAAVDRNLDSEALFASAMTFCRHMLVEPDAEDPRALTPMYSRFTAANPAERVHVVEGYLAGFNDLPSIERSRLSRRWLNRSGASTRRILIGHAEEAPFEEIVRCATRIAAVLYQSDIRWTSITTGRELEIVNGVSIRFVPRREAVSSDSDTLVLQIEQVATDEPGIAAQLFGAVTTDRMHATIPPGLWRSAARAVPIETAEAQAGQEAAPFVAENAAREDGYRYQGDEAASDADMMEEVTRVRPPIVRPAEEPAVTSADSQATQAAQDDAPGGDVVVTWDEPARTDMPQAVSSEDREQPAAKETPAEELPVEVQPRRRRIWLGIALAGVAGLLAVFVSAEQIAASGHQEPVPEEGQSAPASAIPSSSSTKRPAVIALKMEGAAGDRKEEEVRGDSATGREPSQPSVKNGPVNGSGSQGSLGNRNGSYGKVTKQSPGSRPIGGKDLRF